MNKCGFTLIELLVVIILIAGIVLLALPNITNSVKNNSANVDKITFNIIKEATKLYISDNENKFVKTNENTYCVSLKELVEKDYLKNPIQYKNIDITNTRVMKVTYDNGFNYELVDKKECQGLGLPYEYQEVEYIESTGTQYIDTGFMPNNNSRFVLKAFMYKKGGSWAFGVQDNYRSNFTFGFAVSRSDDINQSLVSYSTMSYIIEESYHDKIITADLNKNKFYINDSLITEFNEKALSSSYSMYLFSGNSYGNANSRSKLKVYSFKIYDNNVLVRDMIPCYRKKDDVVGMYDIVGNKFYTNSGTGTFIKGKDI